ncbi:MAG: V-type ATPase subunit [Clostridiales bacterium]|nr:V-type ATPase subunit [Clostridiales bacterium]
MRETEYVYGVARVRVNELSLLTKNNFEQLIAAANYDAAIDVLVQKGWLFEDRDDYYAAIENERQKMWQLLSEAAPNVKELHPLIIANDFQNLKAAIKAFFTQEEFEHLLAQPSVYSAQIILDAIKIKAFDDLPELLQEAAKEAFEAIIKHESGRLADIALDKRALMAALELAEATKSSTLKEIVALNAFVANINIAMRSVAIGKQADFMSAAMVKTDALDNDELIEATLDSPEKLEKYILNHLGESAAKAFKEGLTAFEKWQDEEVLKLLVASKYTAFGLDPLCAYLLRKEIELKNVRIILLAKINSLEQNVIRRRVRLSDDHI